MENPTNIEALREAVKQLEGRINMLENTGNRAASVPESLRDRQDRERSERKSKNEVDRYQNGNGSQATPVSPRRHEQIQARYNTLQDPAIHSKRNRSDMAETFEQKPVPIPFYPRKLRKKTTGYEIVLYPGWVYEIITIAETAEDANSINEFMPEYGDIALDDEDAPVIALVKGDFIYVKYLTDKQGNITETPDVMVSAEELISVHYQPVDGDGAGGTNGTYFIKIGQLVAVGATAAKWVPHIASSIYHWQELWTGINLGSGMKVFKRRNAEANEYEWRTLVARFGLQGVQEANEIQFDISAANVGDGEPILQLPLDDGTPNEPMKVRTIRGRSSSENAELGISDAQITIQTKDSGDDPPVVASTLVVGGNEKVFTLRFEDCDGTELATLSIQDGLANMTIAGSNSAGATIVVPPCSGTTTTIAP